MIIKEYQQNLDATQIKKNLKHGINKCKKTIVK